MRLGLGTDISVGYRQPLFGGVPLLLDTYTGAAAAYSLRQLRTGVTNVVRVREDSGNTEQDFTAEEITDGTLLAFVGAGNNGHVVTWYDQSGNGNDATQATAANQPKIVSAGMLVTDNSLPALDFDGTNDVLGFTDIEFTNNSFLSVVSNIGASRGRILSSENTDTSSFFWFAGNTFANLINAGSSGNQSGTNTAYLGSQSLMICQTSSSTLTLHINSAIDINAAGLTIGSFSIQQISRLSQNFSGFLQEVIIYSSDQSSNRTAIESNINDHYNIYP